MSNYQGVRVDDPTFASVTMAGPFFERPLNGITALAGGGQTGAPVLTQDINRVTTVATAADSVQLPKAVPGISVVVVNAAAANAMNMFPGAGDAINALTANTALSVAANKTLIAFCAVAGVWNTVLTA